MKLPTDPLYPLPAQRAFLVQVHVAAVVAQGHLAGRVEHVVSGQATHFASLEALLAFMARVLTTLPPRPPAPEQGGAAREEPPRKPSDRRAGMRRERR